jgi:quercetin dioxygenase-like cupin family protein
MAEATQVSTSGNGQTALELWNQPLPYEVWVSSVGIPIHKGYFIEDLRKVPLGRWDERGCDAAFIQLVGQEGVAETRLQEIAPGKTLPPQRFGMDEVVYVVDGRGLTTLSWDNGQKTTFEWQKHSMFLLPRGVTHELTNTQGNAPTRMMHTNYLPGAMASVGDIDFFLHAEPSNGQSVTNGAATTYSEAKEISQADGGPWGGVFWYGNFFPSMRAWDNLTPFRGRGAGGHVVWIRFPNSPWTAHMSVFPARTYKKAHRHGPGFVIVIPTGDGYSVMWEEGKEDQKVWVPWQEASLFVPPFRWFHQHFNLGDAPARYLALHPPRGLPGYSEAIDNPGTDQVDYADEDPEVRRRFAEELAKRGMKSRMPEEAYRTRNYQWKYEGD